jgi:hypothetical protein
MGAVRERSMKAVLDLLADFCRAGLRPSTPLAKSVVLALAVKLVAIVSIWLIWFSGDARPPADAATLAHLIGPTAPLP